LRRIKNTKTAGKQFIEKNTSRKAMRRNNTAKRATWDEYFMDIARVVAKRSTCDRRKVGAVLVKDRVILSTGYNGSIRGMAHCDEVGHMMEGGHCVATIHAEANAIVQAARRGISVNGAIIYVTSSPCWNCFKMLINAGIKKIFFCDFYDDSRVFETASLLGVPIIRLEEKDTGK